MRFGNLTISEKGETKTIEFAFADAGKVFVDKDGNTYSSVERARIDSFMEVDYVPPEEATAEDYENALLELGVRV